MSEREELLATCPLCGSTAQILERDFPPIGKRYGVECMECECRCDFRKLTKADAAAYWNRRPGAPAQAQSIPAPPPEYQFPLRVAGDTIRDDTLNYVASLSSPHGSEARDAMCKFLVAAANAMVPSTQEKTPTPEPKRWPAKGDTMTFLGKNGYRQELEEALKIFTPGQNYRVHECNVQNWSHSVMFDGVKGWHNGVMFELCPLSSKERGAT